MKTLFVVTLATCFSGVTLKEAQAGYTTAPADHKPFTETPVVEEPVRTQIVNTLADWSRSKATSGTPLTDMDWTNISRAMALAKSLDSTNRGFIVADFQFSSGGVSTKPVNILDDAQASQALHKALQLTTLKSSSKKDEQRLYGYLIEMVAKLNPADEDAIMDFALFQKQKEVNNWALLLPSPSGARAVGGPIVPGVNPGATTEGTPWSGPQMRSIKGLLVKEGAGGVWVGKMNNLIGSVAEVRNEPGVTATFDRSSIMNPSSITAGPQSNPGSVNPNNPNNPYNQNPNGSYPRRPTPTPNSGISQIGGTGGQMRITLDEAIRLVNTKHTGLKGAPAINLGFEDKYTPKDGGSIGAACAVLILAIVENYDIDQTFAITGDINADGQVKAVGAIDAKIEGAFIGGAKGVVIPSENKSDLEEMLVLSTDPLIRKIQIFSASNIQEAQDLMRTEKPENLKKAMALFDTMQKAGRFTPDKVEEILQLAPNHFSALMMSEEFKGTLPRYLSVKSSLDLIIENSATFVAILLNDSNRSMALDQNQRFTIPVLPADVFQAARAGQNKISKKIDPKTRNFQWSILQVMDAWEQFQGTQDKNASATARRNFVDARSFFHECLVELQMDEATIKELLR